MQRFSRGNDHGSSLQPSRQGQVRVALVVVLAASVVFANPTPTPADTPPTPDYRLSASMAAEPGTGGRLVLFGGWSPTDDNFTNTLNDTWTWDGMKWREHFIPQAPAPRQAHVMAPDGATGTVVLHGGSNSDPLTTSKETWLWNPAARTWTDVTNTLAVRPSCSDDQQGMAYDPVSRKVVLAGCNGHGGIGTWLWDGPTRTWSLEAASNSPRGHAVYDAARRQVVVYRETDGTTWTWDGTTRTWTQQSPVTSPSRRSQAAMAYDAKRQRVVLFGGFLETSPWTSTDETWTWDGNNWTKETPLTSPCSRDRSIMAYHTGSQRVVLFGGRSFCRPYRTPPDTWTWDGEHWLRGLSVAPASAGEGGSGGASVAFTVSLEGSSASEVSVNYATADGTATSGSDYVATAGTLTFAPGEMTKTVTVAVIPDIAYEADEMFSLKLLSSSGAPIVTKSATGTIRSDDPVPSLSIADVSSAEGDSGTKVFAFKVTMSAPSGLDTTVAFATADGTAIAPRDYAAKSGTLTIPAGIAVAKVKILVNGNTSPEPDETFSVTLSNPTNATLADDRATGTIVNDD